VGGEHYADALAASEIWCAQSGALGVHAFDQTETMLGQGTIGLELDRQAPDLDTLLVGVGGGGLIAGIAAWYAGRIRVVGVEPEASPTLAKALAAGRPVDVETGGVQRFVRLTMFIFRLGMRQRGPRRQRLAKELPQLVELLGESRNLFGNACCG